jgi:hypothetical protein
VLGLILTTHFLINRSLGNSIVSLEFFYFSNKEGLLASLSLPSLALNQKSYSLDPSCSLQVFLVLAT